jgi:acetoacetyl-CoA reductase
MQTDLTGKTALVTGGTGGIGAAICKQLAESGAKVTTNYRNEEKAQAFKKEMQDAGLDVHIYQVDVTDTEGCRKMVEDIENNVGPIDIVVNNAGITKDTTLRKMTKEQWDQVMRINLDSLYNICQPIVEGMTSRGWGRIVNISSINGQKGQIGQTNYTTTKAGMHGFTMSLAQEVARKGVTVNSVSPGYIATDMVMAVPEEIREKIIAQIPVGRLGTPEEIAAIITFICSDHAGFITGADISVNGGQHMM